MIYYEKIWKILRTLDLVSSTPQPKSMPQKRFKKEEKLWTISTEIVRMN